MKFLIFFENPSIAGCKLPSGRGVKTSVCHSVATCCTFALVEVYDILEISFHLKLRDTIICCSDYGILYLLEN